MPKYGLIIIFTFIILTSCNKNNDVNKLHKPGVPFILNSNPCFFDPSICFQVPSAPRNLRLNQLRRATPTGSNNPKADYVIFELAWDPPERTHGEIKGYQVSYQLIGPSDLMYPLGTLNSKPIVRNVTQNAFTSTFDDGISKFCLVQ